ncbi:MAG: efflux RND transporter periplasmic adaptor subunit [Pseudomonadota bacterium]
MARIVLALGLILWATVVSAQSVTAVLEPLRAVELRSTVNGRVTELVDVEGSRVSEGDVVAEIDASVQRARVSLAKVTAESEGTVARARELLAQATFRQSRVVAAREKGAAQLWEVELADQAVAVAKADVIVAEDEQRRRVAELGLEQATLAEFTIRAPFDGTVMSVSVDPGEIVDTATVLVKIGSLDLLVATAFVPVDWANAFEGMTSLPVILEDGRQLEANVRALAPEIDPASRTVRLLVEVANTDGALRPGEIVEIADPR